MTACASYSKNTAINVFLGEVEGFLAISFLFLIAFAATEPYSLRIIS